MDIIVCMKQVADSETLIKVLPDGSGIDENDINYVINPYDEYAVEEAVKIKENYDDVTITIVTIGPATPTKPLRTALAMGADKAIHLIDDNFRKTDWYGTASILASAIENEPYDLILCGKQAIDDDGGAVGIELAELLGIPHASVITNLELSENKAIVQSETDGGKETVEVSLPALFTCQKGLNEPRYPALKSLMKAKKKKVKKLEKDDLELNEEVYTIPRISITKFSEPPKRDAGKIIEGETPEAVKELVRLLREEAKII